MKNDKHLSVTTCNFVPTSKTKIQKHMVSDMTIFAPNINEVLSEGDWQVEPPHLTTYFLTYKFSIGTKTLSFLRLT